MVAVELGQSKSRLLRDTNGSGFGLTVTTVVSEAEQPLPEETITTYVPASDGDALLITGFWAVEEKLFGPVHEYEFPLLEVN